MWEIIVNVCGHTAKQAVSPGTISWMCPDTAFSLTPDSIQIWPSSLQAWNTLQRCVSIADLLLVRFCLCGTYCINGHPGFKVVYTAQDQIHWLPFFQSAMTEKTNKSLIWMTVWTDEEPRRERRTPPDAIHEMCKVFHCGDVVVVSLKWHVRIDVAVDKIEQCVKQQTKINKSNAVAGTTVGRHVPECVFCCFHFAETCLVRLEEQSVHIGQLYFIIVKEEQLQQQEMGEGQDKRTGKQAK